MTAIERFAVGLMICVGVLLGQTIPTAHCVFYRERAFTGKFLHANIRIDGKTPQHKLPAGKYWETDLAPGEHRIYSDLERYGRSYRLEPGQTYYFRVEFRLNPPTAYGKLRFQIVPIEHEIATSEMTGFKADN